MGSPKFPVRSALRRLANVAFVVVWISLLPALTARAESHLGIVGQFAPNLDLPYWIDGGGEATAFSLAEQRGKYVYLYFFQNWCPGCHSHGFPTLKQVADAFAGDDRVAVVAVQTTFEGYSVNTRDKVRELQLRYELPITMGHDEGDPDAKRLPKTMRNYRSGGTPWTVIIDPQGRVMTNDFHLNADNVIEYFNQQIGAIKNSVGG